MGKFIPVEPEKWAEMVKAAAEVARLKAEVERLREAGDDLVRHIDWRNVVFTASTAFTFREVIPDCRCSLHDFDKVIEAWNAAKEGKQS